MKSLRQAHRGRAHWQSPVREAQNIQAASTAIKVIVLLIITVVTGAKQLFVDYIQIFK